MAPPKAYRRMTDLEHALWLADRDMARVRNELMARICAMEEEAIIMGYNPGNRSFAVTQERIAAAAEQCPQAAAVLKTLFPEAFPNEFELQHGDVTECKNVSGESARYLSISREALQQALKDYPSSQLLQFGFKTGKFHHGYRVPSEKLVYRNGKRVDDNVLIYRNGKRVDDNAR